ncbi:hypothetical protein M8C21_019095 [Ambrosia artemisiifolia]|uniref:Uncharacterized protein n=1 Tax=Ambrosia artemisiifolia TaxID=4212 RepID=A0AAD5GRQ1_AMBAR|nr:hypothetical protein M8C21_019095 [Ambrosia artemisiifolia]
MGTDESNLKVNVVLCDGVNEKFQKNRDKSALSSLVSYGYMPTLPKLSQHFFCISLRRGRVATYKGIVKRHQSYSRLEIPLKWIWFYTFRDGGTLGKDMDTEMNIRCLNDQKRP